MSLGSKQRGAIKFLFWAAATFFVFAYAIHFYRSGKMVHWYYFQANADGYAVNTRAFADATPDHPAALAIGDFKTLDGLKAAPVKKGDVLPDLATGVIGEDVVEKARRAVRQGETLTILVPWEYKVSKGFRYRDSFTHKNIKTNPMSGVWNLVMVGLIGLCLGYLAEGFTDMIGLKFQKLDHTVGH